MHASLFASQMSLELYLRRIVYIVIVKGIWSANAAY